MVLGRQMSKICTNLSQTEAKNIWGGAVEYVPAIGQVDLSFGKGIFLGCISLLNATWMIPFSISHYSLAR